MIAPRNMMILGVLLLAGCVTGKERPGDGGPPGKDSSAPVSDGAVKGDGKAGKDSKPPLHDLPPVMPNPHKGELTRQGWARIRPGWFYMGSPASELCRKDNEVLHKVTLTHEIEVMQAEVTQGAYKAKVGFNPSTPPEKNCGDNCPVAAVSWNKAVYFCNALSKEMKLEECYTCTGTPQSTLQCLPAGKFSGPTSPIYACKGFRLPTEAEWEYAYRAGSSTAFYNGNDTAKDSCLDCSSAGVRAASISWYCANSGNSLKPIRGKGANRWLLYDMAGSIEEWVDDWYVANLGNGPRTNPWRDLAGPNKTRVLRGGSYLSAPFTLRAAYRADFGPSSTSTAYRYHGFRCVRTLK